MHEVSFYFVTVRTAGAGGLKGFLRAAAETNGIHYFNIITQFINF